MRYLIVSDIHANLEALEAVLYSTRGRYEKVICCGDLVGYGADPGAVLDWVRAHAACVVRGNHDKACAGSEDLEWFNPAARRSVTWTTDTLTQEQLAYLRGLPKGPLEIDGFQVLHGAPLDEDEYLLEPNTAQHHATALTGTLAFFGHTHLQGGFRCHRNGARPIPQMSTTETEYVLELQHDEQFLINPGSVGQPRDHDWRAAYCLYSPQEKIVTYRRVPYDVAKAQEKIRREGLPEMLAERLAVGR